MESTERDDECRLLYSRYIGLSEVRSGPEIPIECAVLNGFADVARLDAGLSCQVS